MTEDLVSQDHEETLVLRDPLVLQGSRVQQVRQEVLVLQDRRVTEDHLAR